MKNYSSLILGLVVFGVNSLSAQNPIIHDQFTADPSARVFENKVYLYPSHDILAKEGRGRVGWFCMEDYHVFSSSNLTDWTDHGVIVSQNKVGWVKPESYSMWAPDCIYKNGKYYYYFPAPAKDTIYGSAWFGNSFKGADLKTLGKALLEANISLYENKRNDGRIKKNNG